jgi:hypothetical protein
MGVDIYRQNIIRNDQAELKFLKGYTFLVNMMLAGKLPGDVNLFYSSNLLIALPKSKVDVRPIGIQTMLRKISSRFLEQEARISFNQEHFNRFQFAMKPGGMEEIIHALNLSLARYPNYDLLSLDATNAFCSVNKYVGLLQILEKFPKAFPLLQQMYMEQSNQFYFGGGEIHVIPAITGLHQGDVLGTWVFIMSLQPLLIELQKHIQNLFPEGTAIADGEGGLTTFDVRHLMLLFYVDDGYICGPTEIVQEALRFLIDKGKHFGYKINPAKCSALLGRCNTAVTAVKRFDDYTNMNLNPNAVHISPKQYYSCFI